MKFLTLLAVIFLMPFKGISRNDSLFYYSFGASLNMNSVFDPNVIALPEYYASSDFAKDFATVFPRTFEEIGPAVSPGIMMQFKRGTITLAFSFFPLKQREYKSAAGLNFHYTLLLMKTKLAPFLQAEYNSFVIQTEERHTGSAYSQPYDNNYRGNFSSFTLSAGAGLNYRPTPRLNIYLSGLYGGGENKWDCSVDGTGPPNFKQFETKRGRLVTVRAQFGISYAFMAEWE